MLESQEEYERGKAEFLSMTKYHDRMPGLFKAEFKGKRMIAVMSKCYYVGAYIEDDKSTRFAKPKFSCKGISKKQNPMSWEKHLEVLNGGIDVAMNTEFENFEQGTVT